MKIIKVNVRNLRVPLAHTYELSKAYGVQLDTSNIIVTITTDEGIVGWGECDPWAAFTGDTDLSVMAVIEHLLAPALIGQDPTNINMIHRLMNSLIKGNNTAKAGIDMACYDILGKYCNMPVHRLLGGKVRDNIKCFWSVGGVTPEETANEIVKIKEEGFWGCMIKIGNDYRNDINRTLAARKAVGSEFPLIADANQGWDVETAIAYGKGVEKADLLFFEQPVKYWDYTGLAKVRDNVPMPISADEGITTIQDAINLISNKSCDYFSIKISKMGGIMPAMKICEYANNYGIKLFFNSMLEEGITQVSSLHLASTVPNLLTSTGHAFFSTLRLQGDITDFHKWTVNGVTRVPNKPGLGFEINYKMLDKYTVGRVEI